MTPDQAQELGAKWAASDNEDAQKLRARFLAAARTDDNDDFSSALWAFALMAPIHEAATAMCMAHGGDLEVCTRIARAFANGALGSWFDDAVKENVKGLLDRHWNLTGK